MCYGSYEKVFLKAMCERYGKPQKESPLNNSLKSPLNILSFIYGQVYFPTFSNGLKEIASHFGYTWTDSSATGVQTIGWRQKWEENMGPFQKQQLVRYNSEDCEALELVTQKLLEMQKCKTEKANSNTDEIIDITNMKRESPYKLKQNTFFFPELSAINKAAYWDYQRERVYLKSNRCVKNAVIHKPYQIKTLQPNQRREAMTPTCCVKCNSKSIGRRDSRQKIVYDLKFVRGGVRRWIVQYKCYRWLCKNCGAVFIPKKKAWAQSRLGIDA